MKMEGFEFEYKEFMKAVEELKSMKNTYWFIHNKEGKVVGITEEPTNKAIIEKILEIRAKEMVK